MHVTDSMKSSLFGSLVIWLEHRHKGEKIGLADTLHRHFFLYRGYVLTTKCAFLSSVNGLFNKGRTRKHSCLLQAQSPSFKQLQGYISL